MYTHRYSKFKYIHNSCSNSQSQSIKLKQINGKTDDRNKIH